MEDDRKTFKHNINKNETRNELGTVSSYRRHKDNNDDADNIPKLDRHGFVVSHRLYSQLAPDENRVPVKVDVCMRRESKWLDMVNNWDELIQVNDNKIKKRCEKGIPQSIRSIAWQRLTGANRLEQQNPGAYESIKKEMAESDWGYVIGIDVPRIFRHHSLFYENNSRGQEDLYTVLLAYSCYDKEIGYHPTLGRMAAVLLMHMATESTFWVLVSICKYYLPGYYAPPMEVMKLDGLMFTHILHSKIPYLARHMRSVGIEPMFYLIGWMQCIFATSLPFDTVLRIWDLFFSQGFKVLFKVALAILKVVFPNPKDLEDKDVDQTYQMLSNLPKHCVVESVLIPEVININITYKDLYKIHKKVLVHHPEMKVNRFCGGTHIF